MRAHETIHAAYRAIATSEPDRLFSEVCNGDSISALTYGDLATLSSRYGSAYTSLGASIGDKIAIILPHGIQQYPAYLGAMEIGGIPSFHTPFNLKSKPELYWSAQIKLIEAVRPKLIVTDERGLGLLMENIPNINCPILTTDSIQHKFSISNLTISQQSHETALIQYSSGTTGPRKGVALSHTKIIDQIISYKNSLEITEQDKIASWLPLYHDMGLITSFLMPLLCKIPVRALDPFEWVMRPTKILDTMESFQASLCWLPNFAFTHIVNSVRPDQSWDLSKIRAIINCSEPCKGTTFDRFNKAFSAHGIKNNSLQVCYAIAENVFAITQTKPNTIVDTLKQRSKNIFDSDILSSGAPIEGVEVKIIGENGTKLDEGELGEIVIRSPFMIEKYFESSLPALDDDGWYATRDQGVLIKGELFVLGRKDDVIVTRGKNIFAHDVEDVLGAIDGLRPGRCAALGLYSDKTETTELVVVLETILSGSDLKLLRRVVVETIESRFGIAPSLVHFAPNDWLFKTSSGKINRSQNIARLKSVLQT